jgi:hypothetical protein
MVQIDNSFMDAQGTMEIDDTERRYHLNCRVDIKTVTRINNGTKYETRKVYLIPEASTELVQFYDAYLPDYIEEGTDEEATIELVFMGIPMSKPFRGYLSKGDRDIHSKHIGLMTVELLDSFSPYKDKIIRIDCLAHSEHSKYDV